MAKKSKEDEDKKEKKSKSSKPKVSSSSSVKSNKSSKSSKSKKSLPKGSSHSVKSTSSKKSTGSKKSKNKQKDVFTGSQRYEVMARETLKRDHASSFVNLPGESLRDSMKQISMMRPLHKGIQVLKLSSTGKLQKRILTLSADQMTLFVTHGKVKDSTKAALLPTPIYTPSKGFGKQDQGNYLRYIDVADLESFCVGVISTESLEGNIKPKMIPSVVTIFHQENFGKKHLNLVIENQAHRMGLVAALQVMKRTYIEAQNWVSRSVLLMRYIWYDIDKDSNQLISKEEFGWICDRINFRGKDTKEAYKEFVHENAPEIGELSYAQCMKLLESIKSKDVVDSIWKKAFGDHVVIPAKTFLDFLKNVQGERDNDVQDAKDLIAILNHVEMPPQHALVDNVGKIDKARFSEYLLSPLNDAYDPEHQQLPNAKLTKPLSHYWINSSHNTFIMGEQLRSKSSVEAFSDALRRGCKLLEIHCWDGPKASKMSGVLDVSVIHGISGTGKASFLSVITLVGNYLINDPDSYPLILALENHCTVPYQKRMVEILREKLRNKLYIPSFEARKEEMPSPEKLKGKVVILCKRPDPDDTAGDAGDKVVPADSMAVSMARPSDSDIYGKMFDHFENGVEKMKSERLSAFLPEEANGDGEIPYVSELLEICYFYATDFYDLEASCLMVPSHMHSIGEAQIPKVAGQYIDSAELWRKFNTTHMTRTYPSKDRVDSSNYNPILAWSLGCQMAGLNFQTHDTNLMLNDGRFRQDGGCGYVLKPKSVMNGERPKSLAIKIRVLSANCLPKPNGEKLGEKIDPYVQIEIHDVRSKRGKEEYYTTSHTTNPVRSNGFCPSWRDGGHQFSVQHNDVAMMIFKVVDEDVVGDDRIACAAIPTRSLRQGFRSVQLYSYNCNTRLGAYSCATLLVHVQKLATKN